jgi:hypothetical protein
MLLPNSSLRGASGSPQVGWGTNRSPQQLQRTQGKLPGSIHADCDTKQNIVL